MKHYTVPEVNWNPIATSSDISKELLSAFMKQNITDVRKTLHKMNLTKNEGDREFVKNEGILLFAKDIKQFFPDFYVDILVYPANSNQDLAGFTDSKFIHTTIPSAIREIMDYLEKTIIKQSTGTKPSYNYPPAALRTALVHAFIHARFNEPIHIIVEPESISILGSHQKQNGLLKRYLAQAGFIYPDADCVASMKKLLAQNGSPEPEITIESALNAICIAIKLHPSFMSENAPVAIQKYIPFEDAEPIEPKIPLLTEVDREAIQPIANELKELDFQQELFSPTEPEPIYGQIPGPSESFYDEADLLEFEEYAKETALSIIEEIPPREEDVESPSLEEALAIFATSPLVEETDTVVLTTEEDVSTIAPSPVEDIEEPQIEAEALTQPKVIVETIHATKEHDAQSVAQVSIEDTTKQNESVEESTEKPNLPTKVQRKQPKKAEEKPVKRTVRKFTSKKSQMESLVDEKDRPKVQPLIDYLLRHDSFTFTKAQELLGKSPATASRYIKILVNAGVLAKTGTPKDVIFEKVKK